MAYDDGRANARILLRTLSLTLDVTGRSRRTEIICWWFASALVAVVLNFALSAILSWKASLVVGVLINAIIAIPMFALFGRRMHDQDRSGWWALLFPASIILSLPNTLRSIADDPEQLIEYQQAGSHPLQWIAAILSILLFILLLFPGTVGPNRFGTDPRESDGTT